MTANYIQNRTIAKRVNQTPFELWTGCKSDFKYLRIFCTKCFVHVLHEKRRELENRAKEIIFIGYNDNSKAYIDDAMSYDKLQKKIVISRDVYFGKYFSIIESEMCRECRQEKEMASSMQRKKWKGGGGG